MFLIYTPADGEPQKMKYLPNRMLSPETEAMERVTGKNFTQITQEILAGNATCRRALLWVLLKRQHPTLKFSDVSFAWEEISLQYSRQEYARMISQAKDNLTGDDLANAVSALEADMADAYDDSEESGKVHSPIAE